MEQTLDFSASQSSLGFEGWRQLIASIPDRDAQRNGKSKWIAVPGDSSILQLNPAYPLTTYEKEFYRFNALVTLLGNIAQMREYFEKGVSNRVLSPAEKEFVNSNKALFERISRQKKGLLVRALAPGIETEATARAWLLAHGYVPNEDSKKVVEQFRVALSGDFNEQNAALFDAASVNMRLLTLHQQPTNSLVANLNLLWENSLNDDPYAPVSAKEHQQAAGLVLGADRTGAGLMRGLGAVHYRMLPAPVILERLKALGLPIAKDKISQWKDLFTHTYNSTTRQFLLDWLAQYEFDLYETKRDGSTMKVNPSDLPRRILFVLLGEFASGDVGAEHCPSVAVQLTPFQHIVELAQQKKFAWREGAASLEEETVSNLFPPFCDYKIASKGLMTPKSAAADAAVQDINDRMVLIDKLLDDGVYAHTRLTSEQRAHVGRVLGIQSGDGDRFEKDLRNLLRPYLVAYNGAFLRSWLDQHSPHNRRIAGGVESLLDHYNNMNICLHGWKSTSSHNATPVMPVDAQLKDVLQMAKADADGLNEAVDLKADDPKLREVCASLPVELEETKEEKKEEKELDPLDSVAAVMCALDLVYMNPNDLTKEQKVHLMKRVQNSSTLSLLHPVSKADMDLQYEELMLDLDRRASSEVLRIILSSRELPDSPSLMVKRETLLQLLAASNHQRFKIVQQWEQKAWRGTLCADSEQALARKLEALQVKIAKFGQKRRMWYFINILFWYLPEDFTGKMLTISERNKLEREGKHFDFTQCFPTYCKRNNVEQPLYELAVMFNKELAVRIIVKSTESLKTVGPAGSSPECGMLGPEKHVVPEDAKKVQLIGPSGVITLVMANPTGGVTVSKVTDKTGEPATQGIEDHPDFTMRKMVHYLKTNGQRVIDIDGVEMK